MVGCMFVLATSCGDSGSTSNSDGGGGGGRDAGSGGPPTAFGGISFPFGLFDGSVPDVPLAAAPGTTWYCDPVHGDDSFDGASFAKAKKTLGGALAVVKAGDTILLGGGIYREYPDWSSAPSGAAGAPITIGSYGRGTGAPILDGGVKPSSWTRYTAQGQTTVWQSSTGGTKISSTEPVLGIYVNTGTAEYALREVIHGQVSAYPGESLPPNQTQANIKDKSNNFYFDAGGNTVYADFGGTVGTGDPNSADIPLLYDSENSGGGHENLIFLLFAAAVIADAVRSEADQRPPLACWLTSFTSFTATAAATSLLVVGHAAVMLSDNPVVDAGTAAARPLLRSGFADDENDGVRTFAWVEGRHASILLPRRTTRDAVIDVDCQPALPTAASVQQMSAVLNGAVVGTAVLAGGWHRVSLDAPARAWRIGVNELELFLSSSESPLDAGLGADRRSLSVAIDRVAVRPSP